MTTFKDAFKIYWKANPMFKVMIAFSILFTIITAVTGGAPFIFWSIIISMYLVILVGSFFNIKKIQERENKNK